MILNNDFQKIRTEFDYEIKKNIIIGNLLIIANALVFIAAIFVLCKR